MVFNDYVRYRFVLLYIFIFFFYIFVINEILVNEEFYISIGLLFFLIYIIVLGVRTLINSLNIRVKNDFFIFIGIHEYFYTYLVDLFKFFKFDLYFWVLLHKLYGMLCIYKKILIYKKLDFNYIYEYTKNTLVLLLLEKYIVNFYNQIILNSLDNLNLNSLNRLMGKYLNKLTKKTFLKKKYLSIIHLFKKTVVL